MTRITYTFTIRPIEGSKEVPEYEVLEGYLTWARRLARIYQVEVALSQGDQAEGYIKPDGTWVFSKVQLTVPQAHLFTLVRRCSIFRPDRSEVKDTLKLHELDLIEEVVPGFPLRGYRAKPMARAEDCRPFGDIYARRIAQGGGGATGLECCLCGRQTKEGTRYMVALNHENGHRFALPNDNPDEVSGYPVGPDCAKICPPQALHK